MSGGRHQETLFTLLRRAFADWSSANPTPKDVDLLNSLDGWIAEESADRRATVNNLEGLAMVLNNTARALEDQPDVHERTEEPPVCDVPEPPEDQTGSFLVLYEQPVIKTELDYQSDLLLALAKWATKVSASLDLPCEDLVAATAVVQSFVDARADYARRTEDYLARRRHGDVR